ncbi:hypothetical protein AAHE18_12G194600 [Arachis hypogaea]
MGSDLLHCWFHKVKGRRWRSSRGSRCLKTNPAIGIHSRSIRFITLRNGGSSQLVAAGGAGWGGYREERMAERIKRKDIGEGFEIRLPFRTPGGWGRKKRGNRDTIGYSKRRKVCGDGGDVMNKW